MPSILGEVQRSCRHHGQIGERDHGAEFSFQPGSN